MPNDNHDEELRMSDERTDEADELTEIKATVLSGLVMTYHMHGRERLMAGLVALYAERGIEPILMITEELVVTLTNEMRKDGVLS